MVTPPDVDATAPPTASARLAASAAAEAAGVVIRPLEDMADLERAALLAAEVWRSPDTRALESSLLRALEHSGNFVAGAFERHDESMVGMSVGFRTGIPEAGLHSHMTCTDVRRRGVGLGAALKLHQRAWALDHGLRTITWTYDPLVGRNAYFNLAKLGATAGAYLTNFYGAMTDGLNAGDESDRLMIEWDLAAARVHPADHYFAPEPETVLLAAGSDGGPVRRSARGDRLGCQVPADVVALRLSDPGLALRWRHELRAALLGALSDDYRITGFSRGGYYVLTRGAAATGNPAAGG